MFYLKIGNWKLKIEVDTLSLTRYYGINLNLWVAYLPNIIRNRRSEEGVPNLL